jgi:hypothetical protein
VEKQKWALHELHDLLGNRAKEEGVPTGDAVGGDHDHVDMFTFRNIDNGSGNVIAVFDAKS